MKAKIFLIISSILLLVLLNFFSVTPLLEEISYTQHQELDPVHEIIYEHGYQLIRANQLNGLLVYEIVGEKDLVHLNELSTTIYLFYSQRNSDPAIRLMLINPNDHEQVLLIMENGVVKWDI